MQAASSKEIKEALKSRSVSDLQQLVLRLARFKKENKELLTYLLFESQDEWAYVRSIQNMMDSKFEEINRKNYYFMKKGVRKVLREVKRFIRYSNVKETEVELLIYFCRKLKTLQPSIRGNRVLTNMYNKQLEMAGKKVLTLHEDLQYDYQEELSGI